MKFADVIDLKLYVLRLRGQLGQLDHRACALGDLAGCLLSDLLGALQLHDSDSLFLGNISK